jgi:hypothetical protein
MPECKSTSSSTTVSIPSDLNSDFRSGLDMAAVLSQPTSRIPLHGPLRSNNNRPHRADDHPQETIQPGHYS